jgi:hypothetical protein
MRKSVSAPNSAQCHHQLHGSGLSGGQSVSHFRESPVSRQLAWDTDIPVCDADFMFLTGTASPSASSCECKHRRLTRCAALGG